MNYSEPTLEDRMSKLISIITLTKTMKAISHMEREIRKSRLEDAEYELTKIMEMVNRREQTGSYS